MFCFFAAYALYYCTCADLNGGNFQNGGVGGGGGGGGVTPHRIIARVQIIFMQEFWLGVNFNRYIALDNVCVCCFFRTQFFLFCFKALLGLSN